MFIWRDFAATVRRVLAEAWNVEFVDLADFLADMIFPAKILCFFQLSVSKGAGTCGNGHGLVAKCFLCSFQKKGRIYAAGKGYGYASKGTKDLLEFVLQAFSF